MLPTLKELRESAGGLSNLSDEDIIQAVYPSYQKYYGSVDEFAGDMGYGGAGRGLTGSRVSSSVDNYQAGMYGLGEAVSGAVGAPKGVQDWMKSGRQDNEAAAGYAEQRTRDLGGIDSIKDVHGLGDFANYAGGLGAQMLPYAIESITGGLAARAASTGLRGAIALGRAGDATAETLQAAAAAQKAMNTRSLAGGVAASYPSSVADILGNQRDQLRSNGLDEGQTDLLSAAIGGVPYAALNALSPTERLLTTGGIGRGIRMADDMVGAKGISARLGMNMAGAAGLEGANEMGQEFVNQGFGRMAVDPNETFFNEKSNDRYLESFAGGATMGGLLGGAAGGWKRSSNYVAPQIEGGQTADMLQHVQLDGGLDSYAPSDGPQYGVNPPTSGQRSAPLDPNQFDMFNPNGTPTYHANPDGPMVAVADTQAALDAPGAPTADVINQAVGVGAPRYAGKNYPSQFAAAANEPTGQRVPDSENGQIEHAETAIEALQRPLNTTKPLHPAVQGAVQQRQADNAQADQAQAMEAQKQAAIQHTTALYGAPEERVEGTTTVHKWLGGGAAVNGVGNYYTKTHSDSAVLKQAEVDAKRVDETDAPPDVVRAAEAAYAESWREAEKAKEKNAGDPSDTKMAAKPVVPGLFKSKQFTQFVEGTNSTQEVADRVEHALDAEETRGDKADYVLVHRLKAFHEKLTGTVAPKQQPAQAPAATPKTSTAVAPVQREVAATENASPGGEVAVVTPEAPAERVTRMATELVAKLGLDPNKTVMLGRKGREKPFNAVQFASKLLTNPEDQPTERARRSAKIDQITVLAATGRDADGDMVSNPLTLDQVALLRSRLEGGSPVSRVAVSNTLAKYGIDEDMASMMVGGDIGPTINASELLGAVEDGDAAGYRIGRSLTDVTSNALLSNSDTEAQKALSDEAGRLSKEDKLALDNAAVDEFLAPPKQEAIEVESNRRLTAERTKAAPAPRLSMVEGEMNASEADEVNERARNEERYARSVMLEWNSNLDDGDIAFEELLEKDQRDVVSLQKLVDDGVVTKREQREIHYAIHDKHHERQNRISAGVQRPNKQITGNGPAGVRTSSGSTESDIPNGRASDNGGGLGQVLSAGAGKQSSPDGEVQAPATQRPDVQGSQAPVRAKLTRKTGGSDGQKVGSGSAGRPGVGQAYQRGDAASGKLVSESRGAISAESGAGSSGAGGRNPQAPGHSGLVSPRGRSGEVGGKPLEPGKDKAGDAPSISPEVVQDAGQALWALIRNTFSQIKLPEYSVLTDLEQGALQIAATDGDTGGKGLRSETALQLVDKYDRPATKSVANAVIEDDSRTIDGTDLVREIPELTMLAIESQVDTKLSGAQQQKLEKHYDADIGTEEFAKRLREDVINYVNNGIESVAAAIRHIIKSVVDGVLAVAVVFNPAAFNADYSFNMPQLVRTQSTQTVQAEVPADAADKMSPLAQQVYQSMAPAAKKTGKGFIVADKPMGAIHFFNADGSLLVQDTALYGAGIGDKIGQTPKVTPAGTYTLQAVNDPEYTGGTILHLTETNDGAAVIAVHPVWLGEPSQKRTERLNSLGISDKRVSYGCINTKEATFLESVLPNIGAFNGGMIFVLPDSTVDTSAMFPTQTQTVTQERTDGGAKAEDVRSGAIGKNEDHSPGGALHIPAYSKVTSNGQTPFPESTVTHAVYHGTRSNFDSGAMEAGDIGIHFGTPAQASDRAGLTDEEKIYRKGVNTHPEDVQFHAGQAINDARRPGYSGQMGKRRMLKIYIDLRNPLRTKDASGWDRLADMVRTVQDAGIELSSQTLDLIKQAKARGQSVISLQTPKDSSIARAYESVRSDIKAAGYDGIVYNNTSEGPRYQALFGGSESNRDSYIVFDKSQISSPDYDLNYSKAAKTQGSKAADILADIKKLMRLDGLSSKVVVVQSVADLPQGVQKSVSVDADTQGFVVNGKAYLVADNIAPGKARSVFLHEVGAHLGLENLLGKAQFAALVGKIKQWAAKADGSQESKLAQAAQQRVTDAGTSAAQSDTELLAYFIEEAVDAGVDPTAASYKTDLGRWVQQVWAAFKQALARMGVKPESLTARDVVDMAYGAARIEASSGAASKVGEVLGRGASFSKAKPVTTQSVVRDVPTAVTDLTDYLKMGRDAVAIRGMFTEDLVNLAAKVIPAAKGYLSAMKTIQAKRGAAERAVESVLNQFRTLSNAEQGTGPTSVNAFLKESTFSGKWAFMPDWLPKGSVEVDKDLAQQFSDMLPNKAAQDVVKAVFKHGYTSLQEMKNAALAMHASEYDVLVAEARKAGDAAEVAKLNRQKVKSMKDFQSLFAIHEFKPYAPLKRFGNYVVLATSARYKAAHEAGDTKTMQELQSDGAHYHVEFAETPWAARKLVATLTPKFPDGFVGKMEKSDDSMMMGGRDTLAAFGRLRKSIKENTDDELMGIDRKTAARMDDMMRQMYLTLLSEASARKSEIHRKNVAGADGDMMRAFATQGRATAHFIAGLQTSGQVDDHIASMREQTRRLDSGPQREERQKYLNEIMRRHSMGLEYHPSPIIDKLMSSSSVMMLLTNPAYHVLNALQPGLMTQPLLAARHGYSKSWGELRRAYTDLGPILRSLKFDETSYAKLPKDVRQAISDLADKGVIDIMMDADLGRFESEPDSALRGVSTVTEKLRHIAQNVEAMNRLSSAIAAYRLEKTKDNATHQSAVDYAAKVIYESHGDYSGFNAPRFMRNDIGRVLTQFRKFQLIQLSLVTREFHRAFFGESAEVKTAGRYALSYTLGHLLATAGVMGLPGATAIGWALGKMTPDDEPDDPEATLRRLIGNKQAADLLIKGAPKALGMDLSRTGAGNTLSLFPYADIDISRDGYPKLLMAATGPFFGGLLPRMAEGLTQASRGNVVKGVEGFMPNGVSNVLRSARFASDGITKTNGDVTLSADELGALDVLAQAFGLPTNKVTDKNFLSNSQYNAEQFYKDKSSELKQRYTKAAKTNDADTMRSLREEWTRVQTTSKEVGITPQPLQNLLKAPGEQRKREQGTQYGVAYTKSTAGYSPALME